MSTSILSGKPAEVLGGNLTMEKHHPRGRSDTPIGFIQFKETKISSRTTSPLAQVQTCSFFTLL